MEETLYHKKRLEELSETEFKQLAEKSPQVAIHACVRYFTRYLTIATLMMLVIFATSSNFLALIFGITFFYVFTVIYSESLQELARYQKILDEKKAVGQTLFTRLMSSLIRTIQLG
jgi:hypothetical protein